jgi:hypothetical protein
MLCISISSCESKSNIQAGIKIGGLFAQWPSVLVACTARERPALYDYHLHSCYHNSNNQFLNTENIIEHKTEKTNLKRSRGPHPTQENVSSCTFIFMFILRNTLLIFTFPSSYLADKRTQISRERHVFIQNENDRNETWIFGTHLPFQDNGILQQCNSLPPRFDSS